MSVRLNITMDENLYKQLKRRLPPKKISAFINDAVRAHLYPDTRALDVAYKAASSEPWRRHFGEEWEITEVEEWPE